MNSRGPWWLGVIIGVVIGIIGLATGRFPLEAAAVLVIVISVGRFLLVGR